MKRLIPILLLCLLLTGCDLRNRQSSEDFIPTGTGGASPAASGHAVLPSGEDPTLPQTRTVIKTVRSYQGEIPLSDPVRTYSYELPMLDLGGAEAVACNQEIEERYGTLIQQSLKAMERYEDPVLQSLSFTSFTRSGILTLRVDRRDLDGSASQAWYTVDAETGEAVSVSALFAAAGVSGTSSEAINRATDLLFVERFGPLNGTDPAYTTALNRTQGALLLLTSSRMHLTEDGRVVVAIELFAPNGGSSIEELILP